MGQVVAWHEDCKSLPMIATLLLSGLCSQACPTYTINGHGPLDRLGYVVNRVGDLNLDGHEEILISAPGLILGRGYVQVYSGNHAELLFEWHGGQAGTEFGQSAADAGDVDGDGHPDVVVGEQVFANGRGRAIVFSGKTGNSIFEFQGSGASSFLGRAVVGMGDLDNDGFSDIAVANELPAQVLLVSTARNSVIATISALSTASGFANSMARLGDVNQDGKADLAICDHQYDGPNGLGEGAVHVFSGADGTLIYSVLGGMPYNSFGKVVAVVGDWTGDGFPDFVASGSSYLESRNYIRCHDGRTGSQFLGEIAPYDRSAGISLAGGVDWTQDGIPDLAFGTLNYGRGAVRVIDAQTRQLIYKVDSQNSSPFYPSALAMMPDRDGDARPELVIGDASDASFALSSGAAHFMISCDPLHILPPSPGRAGTANAFLAMDIPFGTVVSWAASRTLGRSPLLPCRGLDLQLGNPIVLGHDAASQYGIARLILRVPTGLSGTTLAIQAWTSAPCSVSEVIVTRFQ